MANQALAAASVPFGGEKNSLPLCEGVKFGAPMIASRWSSAGRETPPVAVSAEYGSTAVV